MSLDVVTNNFDRFPLIWHNNGNIGNVIIQSQATDGRIVGIDNNCICIKKEYDTYTRYIQKVTELVDHLVKSPLTEFEGMSRVRYVLSPF
jgi:hypothetical protein